jgi:putative acyl-CoA dehydrogenase
MAVPANRHPALLWCFDRFGQGIFDFEFHRDYHYVMRLGLVAGVSAADWTAAAAGHTTHSVLLYLMTAADAGVCCPFSMTYAAVPV